jgi:hypothetical protein
MAIKTIFAHVSCSDLESSEKWYSKLFGRGPDRHPMEGLAEWHFTDSAEVQLFEDKDKAGTSTLTLGVLPLEPERKRLTDADLKVGEMEKTKDFYIMRLRDPDQNLVVLASTKKT